MAGPITGTKIDLVESSGADLPPAGTTRIIRKGGVTQQSVDGAAFAAIGGGSQEYYASLTAGVATTLALSGLNGDADGIYLVRLYIKSAQAANNIKIQINGADTNLNCVTGDRLHGSVAANGSWPIGNAAANPVAFGVGEFLSLEGLFSVRSGRKRPIFLEGYGTVAAANNAYELVGEYADTSTNVTQIAIIGSVASGLSTETFIHVVRILATNPLA